MSKHKPAPYVAVHPIDLSEAKGLLAEILASLEEIDGIMPPQPNGSVAGAPELSRDLLNIADQLTFAAGFVRNEYWSWKGGMSL